MLSKYQNKLNRTIYLSVAILLGIAVFSTFQIERSHAESGDANTAPVAPAFHDTGFSPVIGASTGQLVDNFVQADGKVVVTGLFNVMNGVNKNSIARFNTDGTFDATFNAGGGPNDSVFSVAQQADGKLLIAGLLTAYNGVPVGRIARLNVDGSIDQSFNTTGLAMNPQAGANNQIGDVAVLPDGKIMIGGIFTTYNGTAINRLARLNSDGSLDTSFSVGTGPSNEVTVITPTTDGKIYIGGNFPQYNGTVMGRIARINADGSRDASFATAGGADQTIRTITVQPDGKVIASGFMLTFGGFPANGIIRLNPTGSVDQTFNVAGSDSVIIAHALQPDGKIMIGGSFTALAGATRHCISRLNADGTNDATFDPGSGVGGATIVNDITLMPDGKAILNGTFTAYNGSANGGLIRINADGSFDAPLALTSSVVGNIQALAVYPGNKVMVGGTFSIVGNTPRANIARLNADGTNDASFDPGTAANSIVQSFAVQPDGKIIVGGSFTTFNGATANRIVRLNENGSIDSSFNTGTGLNGSLDAMLLLADGKLMIAGGFAQVNGTVVNRIARLNPDGSIDGTFTAGTGLNSTVKQINLLPDGKFMIGGQFTTYNGITRNRMARINADGTLDTTFDPGTGPNNIVNGFAIHPDGKIVIGGTFTSVAGVAKAKLARLNADGTLDATFDIAGTGPGPGTGPAVTKVLAVENGKTIVTGAFGTFNGLVKNRLIRVNPNGTVDPTFLNGQGAQAQTGLTISSLLRQPDGMVLIGGQFTIFNTSARSGLARFKIATDTYADFDGDGKTDFSVMQRQSQFGQWTWWVNNSSTDTLTAFDFGLSPSDIAQPADYDGDGKDDVAVWRADGINSGYYISQSGTNTVRFIAFGQDGDIPMTEDYDGDGRDDLSVWRAPSSSVGQATWYFLGSLNNPNNNLTFVPWGMRYGTESSQVDKPYPGDFDGDGKADFRVSRRADTSVATANTAAVFYTLSATGAFTQDYWGWASDKMLPGDYDGDGKTDLMVARGFNQGGEQIVWWIRYTGGQADAAINWGTGGADQFAQGDYDGDGTTDLAIYRRAGENNFYVRRSTDQSLMLYHLGASTNDFAVANYNNR